LSCAAIADEAITYKIDIDVFFICWPVCLKVFQKCVSLGCKLMELEIAKREIEAMVDADDCRNVLIQKVCKPHGNATPTPVFAWTWRGKYLERGFAFGAGKIYPQAFQAIGGSARS
jgi:hypothetical protein